MTVLVLLPRILPFPAIFFTDDEMQIGVWTSQMTKALLEGQWQDTANNAYPAVTLAWIEAVQVEVLKWWPGQSFEPSRMVSDADQAVFAELPRRRIALAVINTALVLISFWLLRRLYNNFVAVTATILTALDPFLLTQARVFRTEGLTTGLMLAGALTIILYAKERQVRWLVSSAIFAGLATLTKITSLYMLPFTGLTLLIWPLLRGQRDFITLIKQTIRDTLLWSMVMGLTFFVLWPALWVAPLETFQETFSYLRDAATNIEIIWGGKGSGFFFQGQILKEDPGILFYVWSVAYRTTPLILLGIMGLGIAGVILWQKRAEAPAISSQFLRPFFPVTLLVLAYIVFYFIAMSLGASKVDRYLMPIFPGFCILAAVGFQVMVDWFTNLTRLSWATTWAVWGVVLVSSAWLALPQHPYYFTYWNPLLGGARKAVEILPAGGRQGINMMVEQLNTLPNARALKLIGPGIRDCSVIFRGNCLQSSEVLSADYIISDLFSLQRGVYLSNVKEFFPQAELVNKYTKDGVDYAWLYKLPSGLRHTEEWLGRHGQLRGYGLSKTEVGAGDPFNVSIFWLNGDEGWTLDDSQFFVRLVEGAGQSYQDVLAQPRYEITKDRTAPGEMVVFDANFTIPPEIPLGVYSLEIGLRLKATKQETWLFSLANTDNTLTVNQGILSSPAEITSLQYRLDQPIAETGLTLLGYTVPPTQPSQLIFFWQAQKSIDQDYALELSLLNDQGEQVARWRNSISPTIHPITDWLPGEIVTLAIPLTLGYTLPIGTYHPVLQVQSFGPKQADKLEEIHLNTLQNEFEPTYPLVNMQHRLDNVRFGPYLDLLGYDLKGKASLSSGGSLQVVLYWLNRDEINAAEVDIQILDAKGDIIGHNQAAIQPTIQGLSWHSMSQTEFVLQSLPVALIIKARPTNEKDWYQISDINQPDSIKQIVISDLLSKIMPIEE